VRSLALLLVLCTVAATPAEALRATTNIRTPAMGRGGGVPTVSSCGAGATLDANSFDTGGSITVPVAVVTACTLTFSGGGSYFTTTPRCLVGSSVAASIPSWTTSATALTMAFSVSVSGGKLTYLCW
jgi:hypothetical protein